MKVVLNSFPTWALGWLLVVLVVSGCSDIRLNVGVDECDSNDDCVASAPCQTGTCLAGACAFTLQADRCLVDGRCFQPGELLAEDLCRVCDPTTPDQLFLKACEGSETCERSTGLCVEGVEDVAQGDTNEADSGPVDIAEDETSESDVTVADAIVKKDVLSSVDAGAKAGTCEDYCPLLKASCDGILSQKGLKNCKKFCGEWMKLPPGTVTDQEVNTVGCRIRALTDNGADGCQAASLSGGGVCGSYCENYCDLAFKNCPNQPGFFETFSQCLNACGALSSGGTNMDSYGDSVQCRIYHLGVAGDNQSGGSDTHCPHGAVYSAAACNASLCTIYCGLTSALCPGNLNAMGGLEECQATCGDFSLGVSSDVSGDTVHCRLNWLGIAENSNPSLACPNAGLLGGDLCVDAPFGM